MGAVYGVDQMMTAGLPGCRLDSNVPVLQTYWLPRKSPNILQLELRTHGPLLVSRDYFHQHLSHLGSSCRSICRFCVTNVVARIKIFCCKTAVAPH